MSTTKHSPHDLVEIYVMSNSVRKIPAIARVSPSELNAIIDEVQKEHNWRRRRGQDGKRISYPLCGVLINAPVFTA